MKKFEIGDIVLIIKGEYSKKCGIILEAIDSSAITEYLYKIQVIDPDESYPILNKKESKLKLLYRETEYNFNKYDKVLITEGKYKGYMGIVETKKVDNSTLMYQLFISIYPLVSYSSIIRVDQPWYTLKHYNSKYPNKMNNFRPGEVDFEGDILNEFYIGDNNDQGESNDSGSQPTNIFDITKYFSDEDLKNIALKIATTKIGDEIDTAIKNRREAGIYTINEIISTVANYYAEQMKDDYQNEFKDRINKILKDDSYIQEDYSPSLDSALRNSIISVSREYIKEHPDMITNIIRENIVECANIITSDMLISEFCTTIKSLATSIIKNDPTKSHDET